MQWVVTILLKIIQGISHHSKNSENIDYKIFGDENQIKLLVDKHPIKNKFSIIHAPEKILNDDSALAAAKEGRTLVCGCLLKVLKKKNRYNSISW